MRDINLYTEKYHERSFGVYQARYRRKKIIEEIEKYKPQAILEIGCGDYPLFTDVGGHSPSLSHPTILLQTLLS